MTCHGDGAKGDAQARRSAIIWRKRAERLAIRIRNADEAARRAHPDVDKLRKSVLRALGGPGE